VNEKGKMLMTGIDQSCLCVTAWQLWLYTSTCAWSLAYLFSSQTTVPHATRKSN